MDPADSSLFTQDFVIENGLDFSSLISPSTFIPFQEPYPNDPIIDCIENDGRQRQICETHMTMEITTSNEEPKNKRAKHKEIERKRRHETKSLFKILRDLLPYQYLRGTRSTSDHIFEAVTYIKDLQKKIKEFTKKRDRIMRSTAHLFTIGECSVRSSLPSTCSCVGDTHVSVVVRSCLIGLEIVVSCCVRHKCCLSSVLQLLAQEQCLNVVNCISSTGLHQRCIHTIVSEIEEGVEVYLSTLQEKIIKMIKIRLIEHAH